MASLKSPRFQDDPKFSECLNGTYVFRQSQDYSPSVVTIQKAFEELRYLIVPSGQYGFYGNLTKTAVVKFQSDHPPLQPDGEIGQNTIRVLDEEVFALDQPSGPPAGPPVGPPTGPPSTIAPYGPPDESASWWVDLMLFTPPVPSLLSRNMNVQYIENAAGSAVNTDLYVIEIYEMPTINNEVATAESLFEYIRMHLVASKDPPDDQEKLTLFADPGNTVFTPYDEAIDRPLWESSHPVESVMFLRIYALQRLPDMLTETAAVVTGEYDSEHWRFSTVYSDRGKSHPVSGTREWGIKKQEHEYVFYIRGTDRGTGLLENVFDESLVFAGAHRLWLDMQNRVLKFILDNNGTAIPRDFISRRHVWDNVVSQYGLTFSR